MYNYKLYICVMIVFLLLFLCKFLKCPSVAQEIK